MMSISLGQLIKLFMGSAKPNFMFSEKVLLAYPWAREGFYPQVSYALFIKARIWNLFRASAALACLLVGMVLPDRFSCADQLPALQVGLNDFAAIFPPASADDLKERLHRFKTETGANIVVLTVKSLDGETVQNLAETAFGSLPLTPAGSAKTVLLLVARKEHLVSLKAGVELQSLLPEPAATEKIQEQVDLYRDGLRADLGIHGAVHYLSRVIRGDIRVGSETEGERLQEKSLRGAGASAILTIFLGPFLAFFVGVLWGIYAKHYGVQRNIRLLMAAIFGGATAKLVGLFMALLGNFSDNLWYFIMALAIPLAIFGSLTEFWMSGDWSGIPREKERPRKPEDNMGI